MNMRGQLSVERSISVGQLSAREERGSWIEFHPVDNQLQVQLTHCRFSSTLREPLLDPSLRAVAEREELGGARVHRARREVPRLSRRTLRYGGLFRLAEDFLRLHFLLLGRLTGSSSS